MSDLIDRQAAIDLIDAGRLLSPNEPMWGDNEVVSFLKNRPTIEAIPIGFIKNRLTELAKERNKYEIGTPTFRFIDAKIYYYEMLMEEWERRINDCI